MLKVALKTGDMALFDYLLERDAWLADERFGKALNKPLHIACEYGHLPLVKKLIEFYQVEVNTVCPLSGYTPLMYAVQAGKLEVVRYLVTDVPFVDIMFKSTFSGRDALTISKDAEFSRITEFLLSKIPNLLPLP